MRQYWIIQKYQDRLEVVNLLCMNRGRGVKTPYSVPICVMLKKVPTGGREGVGFCAKSVHNKWTTPYYCWKLFVWSSFCWWSWYYCRELKASSARYTNIHVNHCSETSDVELLEVWAVRTVAQSSLGCASRVPRQISLRNMSLLLTSDGCLPVEIIVRLYSAVGENILQI